MTDDPFPADGDLPGPVPEPAWGPAPGPGPGAGGTSAERPFWVPGSYQQPAYQQPAYQQPSPQGLHPQPAYPGPAWWQHPQPAAIPVARAAPPGPGSRALVVAVLLGFTVLVGGAVAGGWYLLGPEGSPIAVTAPATTIPEPAPSGGTEPSGVLGTGADPSSTPVPTPPATTRQSGIEELRTGDCIRTLTGTHIAKVPVVACSAPHQVQLAGLYTPKRGSYPGHDPLVRTAAKGCAPVIKGILRSDAPPVASLPLVPAKATWAHGDRRVLCFVAAEDESDLTGTVLDTATT